MAQTKGSAAGGVSLGSNRLMPEFSLMWKSICRHRDAGQSLRFRFDCVHDSERRFWKRSFRMLGATQPLVVRFGTESVELDVWAFRDSFPRQTPASTS